MASENLGIKIGTEEEKAWRDIKEGAEKDIAQSKRLILIQKEVVNLAEKMIALEKEKLK